MDQPQSNQPPSKKRRFDIPTLASVEGRDVSRTGRPQRTKKIPQNLRNRFMEVLDDDLSSVIMVYITNDGTVRRDYKKVQEELQAEHEIDEDDSEVDLDEVIAEDVVADDLTASEDENEKHILQSKYSETHEDDVDVKSDDADYVPGQEEVEEEEEEEEDEEDEEDEEEEEEEEEAEEEDEEEGAEEDEEEGDDEEDEEDEEEDQVCNEKKK